MKLTIENRTLVIDCDRISQSPRIDFSNLGTMTLFGRLKYYGDSSPNPVMPDNFFYSLIKANSNAFVDATETIREKLVIEEDSNGYQISILTQSGAYEPNFWFETIEEAFIELENLTEEISILSKEEQISIVEDHYLIYPVYGYSHGGTIFSLTPFSCLFDSFKAGYIYAPFSSIALEYGITLKEAIENPIWQDLATRLFESEIEMLNQFNNGEVFRFELWENDRLIDACAGFYGSEPLASGILSAIPNEFRGPIERIGILTPEEL